jgi:hypothetical protein
VVFTTVQSPTFGGTSFDAVGPYEKLAGRAFGEIDPSDPHNGPITDLALAPRNAAGKVEYSMDVYLLKPVDMSRASGRPWADGRKPPPSRVPRRADGTLVPSLPQTRVRFPAIPGVTYNGLLRTGDLLDFGPSVDQGVLTVLPPVSMGTPYTVLVPKTDRDGNDVAGIRLPAVAVPTATYTGWALRAPAFAGNDLGDASGQQIPLLRTKAERPAAGDPRPSLAERYGTHARYVKKFARAAKRSRRQWLLLPEDAVTLTTAAAAAAVL